MDEPIAGALFKLTAEGGKAIRGLPARGRALVKRVPPPVQIELAKLSSRGAHVCREIFAGVLVVGLIAIVFGYGRLAGGPISLPNLVPPIEAAINDQLTDLHVTIDDAVLQRSADGPGVLFRLRNIRLIDKDGSIVAQAPLAAIGMSGSALLSGRLAPGSVDFIGPRLLLSYNSDQGLALSFTRPSNEDGDALIRGALPADGSSDTSPGQATPETVITKHPEPLVGDGGRKFNLKNTVAEIFDRSRRGDTSYLTRFGVKNAIVVLNQDGAQTLWQVPDFSIDLEHLDRRSVLVGQANVASSKGDWQLEVRTEQRTRRNTLGITALIENLVPSGIAGNFPSIGLLRALDMAVDGETTLELDDSGEFLSGEAKLRLAPGQVTPPWDRDTPLRIDHGDFTVRYLRGTEVIEIAPSTLRWGKSQATISGELRPVRNAAGKPVSWDFTFKAENAVFAVEEFGLGPTKIDEWTATGSIAPTDGRMTLSRFVIRAGDASIAMSGDVVDAPGSPAVNLAGEVSAMPVDTLKQLWPKFLAGKARQWVLERVAGGQVLGGKFNVALPAGAIAEIEQGAAAPEGAVNVELNFSGMSIVYIPKMPPVVMGDAKLTVSGTEFTVDIPTAKIAAASGQEVALSGGRFFIPDLREDPQQGVITFTAAAPTPTVMQLLDHEPLGYLKEVGMKPDFLGGSAVGEFTFAMPLKNDLDFEEIKMSGLARLDDAIASNLVGDMDIDGGALDVELSEEGVTAKGEIKIKDVPAEIHWQRVFHAPDGEQPPVRVSATLDEALREKLGIKVNHLVKGPTPLTLSVTGVGQATQTMSMEADLTNAQLLFGSMGWTKPAGKAAIVSFDVDKHTDGSADLQNFKIVGDDIGVDGKIALDPQGKLNGKELAAVVLKQKNGARLLQAEAHNAGAAFRLVGFYRSIKGGQASLQVNMDAGGPGTKSGTLWASNFEVVGDPVVADVLTDPSAVAVLGKQKQQIARSNIVFKRLRAPFIVGAGKFQLRDAYVNGPAIGATMRGTVDFKSQTVDLGGTYVPLYGLNSALGAIPLLGRVLVGREGEGVVGITFAIKGKLDDPAVLVNPMSVMTPGIFRQIFEFKGSVPDPNPAPAASSFMVPGQGQPYAQPGPQ